MSKNDEKILQLKKKIEEKRKQLQSASWFSPKTNCVMPFFPGKSVNIHSLTVDEIRFYLAFTHSLVLSAKDLGMECPKVGSFSIQDFRDDLQGKLDHMLVSAKRKQLEADEKELANLLSLEKKTELAIDEIAGRLD